MSHIGFNTSDYEPYSGSRKILPRGDYIMLITNDEYRQNKKNTGSGYLIDWQICEGQYAGTELKSWLNYDHQNQTTEKIGRGELRAITDACGVLNPRDTCQLYNIPMLVTLEVEYKVDPDTGQQIPDKNTFEKYKRLGDATTTTPNNSPPQQTPPVTAYENETGAQPWDNN